MSWPNRELIDLIGIDVPIVQAPMAGANGSAMAIEVCEAGGLGSLPCAMLDPDQVRSEIGVIRAGTSRPFNVNFFCHRPATPDARRLQAWKTRLEGFYRDLGLDTKGEVPFVNRSPFDERSCEVVEELAPQVVSFHFGLPDSGLLARVKAAGCVVLGSATTVGEARWLEERGCDVIIAQGAEAGGHRGMFLTEDVACQPGTFALVPQVVDAVSVPVIAAGGIADGRGVAAAFALGAAAVQVGTAYLFTPESLISELHRTALRGATADGTTITNVFTGRPARSLLNRLVRDVGPMAFEAPDFPSAAGSVQPLKAAAEALGSDDYSSLWSGQSAALAEPLGSRELTRRLAQEGAERLRELS